MSQTKAELIEPQGNVAFDTNTLYVDATNNRVGVGTTSPTKKLQVEDTSATSTSTFTNVIARFVGAASNGDANVQFSNGVNSSANIGIAGGANLYFGLDGVERARIDNSGRLLVGTSTARTNMFGGSVGPATQVEGASANGSISSIISSRSDSGGAFLALAHQRSGAVGGNTILQSGDYFGGLSFQGSDGTNFPVGAEIAAFVDGTPGANDMPGRLVFSTTADGASSPTERMRITQEGVIRTGRGLVVGSIASTISNFDALIISGSAIASGAGTNALKWNSSSGVVTYDTSSRLIKEAIVDCPYGISALKQLRPRKYFRTDDQREEIGFVADEVVQILPEFVPIGPKSVITRNDQDTEVIPLGVNYDKLTAVLTKALQEAIGRIENLEVEVAALKAQ